MSLMTTLQAVLVTPRLHLLPPHTGLARAMLDYQVANRQHFAPWDPKPGDMFFTELYWTMQLRQQALGWEQGMCALFAHLPEEPQRIVGTVSLSNIVRGVFQAAHLGYGIDHSLQGQGLMHEAVSQIIRFAFDDLRLHRLQAITSRIISAALPCCSVWVLSKKAWRAITCISTAHGATMC
jgi:ribosomal-protein-alanine N-acetyltransferase